MARTAPKKAAPASAQLCLEVETIVTAAPRLVPPEPSAPPSEPLPCTQATYLQDRYDRPERPAFGGWLLKQKARDGLVGALAAAATADRSFPKNGDVEAVLKHLGAGGADGDMFEALDDAERAWLAS